MKKSIISFILVSILSALILVGCGTSTKKLKSGIYCVTAVKVTYEAADFVSQEQFDYMKSVENYIDSWDLQRYEFDGENCYCYYSTNDGLWKKQGPYYYKFENNDFYIWDDAGFGQSLGEIVSISGKELVLKYQGIIRTYSFLMENNNK